MPNKFLNYFNKKSGSNKIFSREDIGALDVGEFSKLKSTLAEQVSKIGAPTDQELSKSDDVVQVKAYTKDDGTTVKSHWRSKPHGAAGIREEETTKKGTFLPDSVTELYNKLAKKDGTITGAAANAKPKPQQLSKAEWEKAEKDNKIKELMKKVNYAPTEVQVDWAHHKVNNVLNKNHKDAQYLMNLFIDGPNKKNLGNEAVLINPANNYSLAKENNLEIDPGLQGIQFKPDSSLAQTLNNSEELKEIIKSNFEPDGKHSSSLPIKLNKDTNIHRAINGATLYGLKDEGDYYSGYLFDKYDFENNKYDYSSFKKFTTSVANNYAVGMQAKNAQNYYIIVPIRIKK